MSRDARESAVLETQLLAQERELCFESRVFDGEAHAGNGAVGTPAADDAQTVMGERDRVDQCGHHVPVRVLGEGDETRPDTME